MTYTYTLDQNDYLNHQLFFASISEQVRKQRQKSAINSALTFLFLAFVCYREKEPFFFIWFIIAGAAYTIFNFYNSKRHYKKQFETHVNTVFKNRFDKATSVIIDEQTIQEIEENYETKAALSEIEQIYETSDYFYAHLKSGITIIFPRQKIENADALEDQLRDIASENQIRYTEMMDWKWK